MLGVIWSGAGNGSDVLLLAAAIVAGIDAIWLIVRAVPESALLPAAVALVALGLLAI